MTQNRPVSWRCCKTCARMRASRFVVQICMCCMCCMCCKTMRCMCCETTRCMCCKTMSGRHTEEHMSCNSERVVVPRSLTECISAEKNCSCIHPNHRNGNMWHLFLPPYKSQKPLHVTPFPLSLQSEETVTCDTFSLVPPNPRNRYM